MEEGEEGGMEGGGGGRECSVCWLFSALCLHPYFLAVPSGLKAPEVESLLRSFLDMRGSECQWTSRSPGLHQSISKAPGTHPICFRSFG